MLRRSVVVLLAFLALLAVGGQLLSRPAGLREPVERDIAGNVEYRPAEPPERPTRSPAATAAPGKVGTVPPVKSIGSGKPITDPTWRVLGTWIRDGYAGTFQLEGHPLAGTTDEYEFIVLLHVVPGQQYPGSPLTLGHEDIRFEFDPVWRHTTAWGIDTWRVVRFTTDPSFLLEVVPRYDGRDLATTITLTNNPDYLKPFTLTGGDELPFTAPSISKVDAALAAQSEAVRIEKEGKQYLIVKGDGDFAFTEAIPGFRWISGKCTHGHGGGVLILQESCRGGKLQIQLDTGWKIVEQGYLPK